VPLKCINYIIDIDVLDNVAGLQPQSELAQLAQQLKQRPSEKKTCTPKFLPITFFPLAFETFCPTNQAVSDFCVRYGTTLDSPSSFNFFSFSTSFRFYSAL